MTHKHPTERAARIEAELRQFTGDLDRYRHNLNRRVIYTPGVRHLAEAAEAYWLIDAIASWIGSHSFNQAVAVNERIAGFHFWTLEVAENNSAILRAFTDSDEPPFAPQAFITQRIPFTDFPLPQIAVWCGFDGEHWTLYLPSEH
jgi:hypothetical protein